GVDQAAAIVAHLVDHHVVGRLGQHVGHLVAIGDDGVAYHFDGNWIDLGHWEPQWNRPMRMIRWPVSATVTTSPGATSVVEFCSSITAGPSTTSPGLSAGRQTMRASSGFDASSKMTERVSSRRSPSALHGSLSQ